MECDFLNLLAQMTPHSYVKDIAEHKNIQFLEEYQREHTQAEKRVAARKQKAIDNKSKLIDGWLAGRLSQADFDLKNNELEKELASVSDEEAYLEQGKADPSCISSVVELALCRTATLWKIASPEDRLLVQNHVFQSGLLYDREKGILNSVNTNLFNVLDGINTEKINLASPTGFEPVLPP
jgi:hypothetical protein